ncbi:AAA family ATPase [Cellulomonas sp. ATA003]|uniref:AAA family ATPase n=1 Tax=Cellulomonas sp. ATA003 TaxID=3073064 RepID=UPI002873D0FA|nr:AAA family ATPase [Cellulomonas sp. ATA003]WNB84859.1 AAA family ATPase [Cellulomonas sp. ATA003]
MLQAVPTSAELDELVDTTSLISAGIERVVAGRPQLVRLTLAVLLAEGHLLLEDVPGVGKTTLAKALARSIDCSVGRIQFTPDLLPSDLTGVNIFRAQTHEFEFRPGPVFANIVIGDEINRASPKTQSALLECMQESQATVDGATYPLPRPFLVIATQNPVEMEGTYPLPEAQRDRFMARLSAGYPDRSAELEMLERQEVADPLADLAPVTDAAHVARLIATARRLYAAPAIKGYVLDLVAATRTDPGLRLGASPRASIQLLRAAKALAALSGRDHVLPDDVQEVVEPVLAHRLLASTESRLAGRTTLDVVRGLVARTALPPVEAPRARRATG